MFDPSNQRKRHQKPNTPRLIPRSPVQTYKHRSRYGRFAPRTEPRAHHAPSSSPDALSSLNASFSHASTPAIKAFPGHSTLKPSRTSFLSSSAEEAPAPTSLFAPPTPLTATPGSVFSAAHGYSPIRPRGGSLTLSQSVASSPQSPRARLSFSFAAADDHYVRSMSPSSRSFCSSSHTRTPMPNRSCSPRGFSPPTPYTTTPVGGMMPAPSPSPSIRAPPTPLSNPLGLSKRFSHSSHAPSPWSKAVPSSGSADPLFPISENDPRFVTPDITSRERERLPAAQFSIPQTPQTPAQFAVPQTSRKANPHPIPHSHSRFSLPLMSPAHPSTARPTVSLSLSHTEPPRAPPTEVKRIRRNAAMYAANTQSRRKTYVRFDLSCGGSPPKPPPREHRPSSTEAAQAQATVFKRQLDSLSTSSRDRDHRRDVVGTLTPVRPRECSRENDKLMSFAALLHDDDELVGNSGNSDHSDDYVSDDSDYVPSAGGIDDGDSSSDDLLGSFLDMEDDEQQPLPPRHSAHQPPQQSPTSVPLWGQYRESDYGGGGRHTADVEMGDLSSPMRPSLPEFLSPIRKRPAPAPVASPSAASRVRVTLSPWGESGDSVANASTAPPSYSSSSSSNSSSMRRLPTPMKVSPIFSPRVSRHSSPRSRSDFPQLLSPHHPHSHSPSLGGRFPGTPRRQSMPSRHDHCQDMSSPRTPTSVAPAAPLGPAAPAIHIPDLSIPLPLEQMPLPRDEFQLPPAAALVPDDLSRDKYQTDFISPGAAGTVGGFLGQGSFADVFKLQHRQSNEVFAVKIFAPKQSLDLRETVLHEVSNLYRVQNHRGRHKNCLEFVEAWQHRGLCFMQTEFCARGTLAAYLQSEDEPLREQTVWRILEQMARGLHHVHSVGLIHMDMKPENVFIRGDNSIAIGDFGIAKRHDQGSTVFGKGTNKYLAPEIVHNGKFVTSQSDVYSMGLIAYEMAFDCELPKMAGDAGYLELRSEKFAMPSALRRSAQLCGLVERMLRANPRHRCTARDVIAVCVDRSRRLQQADPLVLQTPMNDPPEALVGRVSAFYNPYSSVAGGLTSVPPSRSRQSYNQDIGVRTRLDF